MSLNKQITINEVLSAIRKHRARALITFILLMVMVFGAFILMPRKYGSEGRLFVQLARTGANLDPSSGNASISIQDSRETEIRSVAEIVKSRAVIEPVVDQIGADKILKSPFDFLKFDFKLPTMTWNQVDETDSIARKEYDRLKKKELAAKALEESLVVHTEKKTSVISIYLKASSPTLAQKIVNTIMKQTQAKHLEVHSVQGSTEFFGDNFKLKERELIQAENRLRDFRNQHEVLTVSGARATKQNIINKLELDLIDTEINHSQSKKRFEDLSRQMAKIDATIAVPKSGVEKLSTEDSRTEIFKLESQLRQLEKRYNPEHPKLRPLRETVLSLKSQLNAMPEDRTESESQLNPVFEKIKVAVVNASAETNAFEARLKRLREKHTQALVQLKALNSTEIEASQLARQRDIARQEMDIYVRKMTETSVIDELDRSRISDIVVAQEANFVVKHVSPRGSILIPLGAVMASLCAIGIALYSEKDLLSGHLSEEEVEQILEIPILVSLPNVPSQRNMIG